MDNNLNNYKNKNNHQKNSLQIGGSIILDNGWDINKFLKEIESNLMHIAGIDKLCCIRSKKIDNTLKACDLYENEICVEHPRAVIQRKFTLEIDENEKISFAGGQGGEKRIDCLFRHIRNSFAHTNTYFFNNGNVLLEDKDGTKITSMILIKGQTLLDWIHYIDKDNRFYSEGDLWYAIY